MAFYNHEDYLSATSSTRPAGQMQMKQSAPLVTRPESPVKRPPPVTTLPGIPGTTPGPNAFAQYAALVDKHRLNSNAFYQKEVHRRDRGVTPPITMTMQQHPALRGRSFSDPPTPPPPSQEETHTFIDFSGSNEDSNHNKHTLPSSPVLQLIPSHPHMAIPTRRAIIEGQCKQRLRGQPGGDDENIIIPVFRRTPKFADSEFARPPGATPGDHSTKHSTTPFSGLTRTPKKSLLEKFRLPGVRGHPGPGVSPAVTPSSSRTLSTMEMGDSHLPVPAKARAVLGSPKRNRVSLGSTTSSSPSKTNIPRSPSKRKYFFSRKISTGPGDAGGSVIGMATSEGIASPTRTVSSTAKTPQTSFSDPTYSGFHKTAGDRASGGQRSCTGTTASNKQGGITRSQSLKYFDLAAPPTPPAKNTPPHEKGQNTTASQEKSRSTLALKDYENDFTASTSSARIMNTSAMITPTRFIHYGRRDVPKLVTQPSMYSLHASVVPDLTDPSTLEEMKARVDGLGLEGFSMPLENTRSPHNDNHREVFYSPSTYSVDLMEQLNPLLASKGLLVPSFNHDRNSSTKPAGAPRGHRVQYNPHDSLASSRETVQIVYPELAEDPSVAREARQGFTYGQEGEQIDVLGAQVPSHGYTHSPDHSTSPCSNDWDSSIFACHVDDDWYAREFNTPSTYSHQSAMVSPLLYLQPTTYSPPSKVSGGDNNTDNGTNLKKKENNYGLGINESSASRANSPTRQADIIQSAPLLSPAAAKPTSLPNDATFTSFENNVDPLKPQPLTSSPSSDDENKAQSNQKEIETDRLDRMMSILCTLQSRYTDTASIREEMRASTARLDGRLTAMECSRGSGASLHASEPSPPSSAGLPPRNLYCSSSGDETDSPRKRVATCTAEEFYRLSNPSPQPAPSSSRSIKGAIKSQQETKTTSSGEDDEEGEKPIASSPATREVITNVNCNDDSDIQESNDEKRCESKSHKESHDNDHESDSDYNSNHNDGNGELQTLAELRETNRQLMQMMNGFVERIRLLEGKVQSNRDEEDPSSSS